MCRSLRAEALQATASEGLVRVCIRGGYRAGFEPATFRSKGIDSTNALPRPIAFIAAFCSLCYAKCTSCYESPNFDILCSLFCDVEAWMPCSGVRHACLKRNPKVLLNSPRYL